MNYRFHAATRGAPAPTIRLSTCSPTTTRTARSSRSPVLTLVRAGECLGRYDRGVVLARQALGLVLATRVATPPEGDVWTHEVKFDGYRIVAHVDGRDVRLVTRSQNDWTSVRPAW